MHGALSSLFATKHATRVFPVLADRVVEAKRTSQNGQRYHQCNTCRSDHRSRSAETACGKIREGERQFDASKADARASGHGSNQQGRANRGAGSSRDPDADYAGSCEGRSASSEAAREGNRSAKGLVFSGNQQPRRTGQKAMSGRHGILGYLATRACLPAASRLPSSRYPPSILNFVFLLNLWSPSVGSILPPAVRPERVPGGHPPPGGFCKSGF